MKDRFPRKFDQGVVGNFTGAEILGEKKNFKALPVEFVKVESLDDPKVVATVDDFDQQAALQQHP